MKIVQNSELKKFILAHNNDTDEYMILEYRSSLHHSGYVNIFDYNQGVLFSRHGGPGWDIIKTSDHVDQLISGWNLG